MSVDDVIKSGLLNVIGQFSFRNVIVYIAISSCSFVFSQSRVKVSTSLTNVGGLAVGAFDLINRSLSVVGFVFVRWSVNVVK